MPAQRPGKSKQDYGTPIELIRAVEKRWGALTLDLAASEHNAKAPYYFTAEDDFLKQDFTSGAGLPDGALCWLNPPFENLGPWMAKCAVDAAKGAQIIMLVPASVGSEWFATHVWPCPFSKVIALRPRLTFEGCKDPYPKDCMLILWGSRVGLADPEMGEPKFDIWRWKP